MSEIDDIEASLVAYTEMDLIDEELNCAITLFYEFEAAAARLAIARLAKQNFRNSVKPDGCAVNWETFSERDIKVVSYWSHWDHVSEKISRNDILKEVLRHRTDGPL